MASVWVIEQGSYSDYHVVGVFSSRENAEVVLGALPSDDYDTPEIAEWALDPAVAELNLGYRQFHVLMLRDGTTEHVKQWHLVGAFMIGGEVALWRRASAPAYRGQDIQDCLNATVWAKDKAHATKIVNEHRTRMIANGEW